MTSGPLRIVVVGASAAGLSAAQESRRVSAGAEITLVSEEPHLPYHRPALTERIGDDAVERRPTFFLQKEAWFDERRIRFLRGVKATALDPAARTVSLSAGTPVPFDRLILAVGSKPFVPLAGVLEKENVFAVRTLDDARRVADAAGKSSSTVIVGGGLLGLETTNALLKRGHEVHVVELADRMLPMQLDPEGSRFFQRIAVAAGAIVHLSAQTKAVLGEGKATGVLLASGEEIAAGMLVFSIGVRANIELAHGGGLAVNRGIVVNERMETSVPGIYAAGDCAEFGRGPQLWMPAVRQGTVAGANAAGGDVRFVPEAYPAMLRVFGTQLYSVGDTGRDPQAVYETARRADEETGQYRALFLRGGRLVGAILVGDIKRAGALSKAVAAGIDAASAGELLK